MDSEKLYTKQNVAGKGVGLVAAVDILKGTRILSEPPILRIPRSLNQRAKRELAKSLAKAVSALCEETRQAFFALANSFENETTQELGIVRTNALPLGSSAAMGGIFPDASRINHACISSAQNTWNEDLQQLTIHAVRDISKGEEITITYLSGHKDYRSRQQELNQSFNFSCSCRICALPPPLRETSDMALIMMQRLDDSIGDATQIFAQPLKALHNVETLLRLFEENGIYDASVPRAYYDAFQVAVINSDLARASVFAERAAAARTVVEGEDSPDVRRLKSLALQPAVHSSCGISPRWLTERKDVPVGLGAAEFHAWLWRHPCKQAVHQRQFTSFRDNAIFRNFSSLPHESDGGVHWGSDDEASATLDKDWCFIAEVVEVETFLRLRLLVKDQEGRNSIVAFYTDGRGLELDCFDELAPGFTIVILYAEQHDFIDGTTGVRQEDIGTVKFFPVPLKDFLALGDKIQQYAAETNKQRVCQGCGTKAATLKKCSRCSMFWYCDKACQTRGWKEKGHRADCRLLADPDLQTLLQMGLGSGTRTRQSFLR